MALRIIRRAVPAIGVATLLCACAPSDPLPIAAGHSTPMAIPAVVELADTPHNYSGSSEPHTRHHAVARQAPHHPEPQQAEADTVNPPFGAGE